MIFADAFQSLPLAQAADLGYGPIGVLLLVVMTLGAIILLLTQFLPKLKREGARKDDTYESGMKPIGDARRRFNVRFYLVAMLFLLFDVELIFMYPCALLFARSKGTDAATSQMPFFFYEMVIFFAILLVGYIYAWAKGVFQYD